MNSDLVILVTAYVVSIAILVTPFLVLADTAAAVATEAGRAGVFHPGPHGFSEVLYGASSAANNNGGAFAGLGANTPFYNIVFAFAMWFGRFAVIAPVLAIAGSFAVKRADREVHLTPIEYRLLTALIGHPGKVLTHRRLLAEVWGPGYVEHSHYLRIYMENLRHKLEADPTRPQHLLTETGIGYRFVP